MQTSNTGPESDDDEEEEAEDRRAYTEMESLEALRKDPAKLLQFMDDGRLDLLKFATATKAFRYHGKQKVKAVSPSPSDDNEFLASKYPKRVDNKNHQEPAH